jgi:hypothetical protein
MTEIIRLEYTPDAAGLRAAFRHAHRATRLGSYVIGALMMGGGMTTLVALTGAAPWLRWLALAVGLLGALVVVLRTRSLFERRITEQLVAQPWLLASSSLEARPDGFTLRSAGSESDLGWSIVYGVSVVGGGVVLHTGGSLFWYVPDAAFASLVERQRFVDSVNQWRSSAPIRPERAPWPVEAGDASLSVALNEADYVALSAFVMQESTQARGWRRWVLPVYLSLLAAVALVLHGWESALMAASGAAMVVALLLVPNVSIWLLPWRITRLRRRFPARFPTEIQELVVGPRGVGLTGPIGRVWTPWGRIVRVAASGDHVFLFVGPLSAYVVPKRAFSEQDVDTVVSRWSGWHADAPQRQGVPAVARGQTKDSSNPFEPPAAS